MSIASMIAGAGQSTATHERPTFVQGASGARRQSTWATVHSAVKGWLQPAAAKVVERFMALGMIVSHEFYTETSLAAVPGDRLTIGSTHYLVRGNLDAAGLGRLYSLAVEEVR